MKDLTNYADSRVLSLCVQCGGKPDTRDHAPCKVFLDKPYPTVLPNVPTCYACNNGASKDEEYLACLVECVISGKPEVESIGRDRIRDTLSRKKALWKMLQSERREVNGQIIFNVNYERVERVIIKLARAHAAYELNEPQYAPPSSVSVIPMNAVTSELLEQFESPVGVAGWPEVGSRSMQRMVGENLDGAHWLVVQPGLYRFMAVTEPCVTIRIVLREYLVAEVIWTE